MKRLALHFLVLAAALSMSAPLSAMERDRAGAGHIAWPTREFPTLQSAIDALAVGGTLSIAPGTFDVDEPLVVNGKDIVIKGAGCGVTRLNGPRVAAVVEPDRAAGVINYLRSRADLQDVELSGFDAGVRIDDRVLGSDAAGQQRDEPHRISKVCISNTGRGILAYTDAKFLVKHVTIKHILWNGISLVGSGDSAGGSSLVDVFIEDVDNIGIFKIDKPGTCDLTPNKIEAASVNFARRGGIVLLRSGICITDSTVAFSNGAGIAVLQSAALIKDSHVAATAPLCLDPPMCLKQTLGDGILISADQFPSEATVLDTLIEQSARVGLTNFGSTVHLGGTHIDCNSIDLDGEEIAGFQATWNDLGGNVCSCGGNVVACQVKSENMEPPDSLTQPEPVP